MTRFSRARRLGSLSSLRAGVSVGMCYLRGRNSRRKNTGDLGSPSRWIGSQGLLGNQLVQFPAAHEVGGPE